MMETKEIKNGSHRQWLLAQIETFLANNPSISAEGFGWYSCKDSSVVLRLRKGGDITTGKMDDILAYLVKPHQSRRSYIGRKSTALPPT